MPTPKTHKKAAKRNLKVVKKSNRSRRNPPLYSTSRQALYVILFA